MAGVGRIVTELCRACFVPRRRSHSVATASGMAEQGPELADGTPVTAIVGNGGLTPFVLGVVEEWLAFNASVRQAGERQGRLSLAPRSGLERGGDRPAGPRGVRMGRMLGFFESFTFFQIGRRPWVFVGSVVLTCVCAS